ncbi:MAG: MXAN_5187 C-terminal domain-containing protein [Myxococcota bacterium]
MAAKDKRSLFGGSRGRGAEPAPAELDLTPELDALESDLNELRSTYELYFMGIERMEPTIQRDKIRARIRQLREKQPRNTAMKFRMQQIKARLVSFENHWNRVNRAREAGTYRRDLARVQRRTAVLEAEQVRETLTGPPTEVRDVSQRDGFDVGAGAPAAPSTGGRQVPMQTPSGARDLSRPRARRAEDLNDNQIQRLYQTYVGARRRCGESVDVRMEDMATALRRQVPELIKRTGARSVEFKVVIRAGKAVLKALPRHED